MHSKAVTVTLLAVLVVVSVGTSAVAQTVPDVRFLREVYNGDDIPWSYSIANGGSPFNRADYIDGYVVVTGKPTADAPQNMNGLYLFSENGTFLGKRSHKVDTGTIFKCGHTQVAPSRPMYAGRNGS